jgi:D-2-hydroxyacid dehydrogenase (NADP+)
MSPNVLIIEAHADIYAAQLHAMFPDLTVVQARDLSELPHDLSGFDALLAFGIIITDDTIRRLSALRWIQSLATGVDHFLRCPSLRPQVLLTSARGIHGLPMRETVVYLMMGASRQVVRQAAAQNAGIWDRQFWNLLAGKTAVVCGIGVVGEAVGQLLKAFGMRVVGVTRTSRAVTGFDELTSTDHLADIAAQADFLINILPASPQNEKIFDDAVFGAMKRSAYFINAGRGQTVDEPALIDCLRAGRIAGAGLDVFEAEPLPPDSPFWTLPNVFITPHIGGYVVEYEELVMPLVIDNMRHFLAGRPQDMRNIVKR